MEMFYRTTNTASAVAIADIPVVEYEALYNDLKERMTESRYHVAHYFATECEAGLKFYMIILDDETGEVLITSFVPDYYAEGLASLTAVHQQFTPSSARFSSSTPCPSMATHGSSPCASRSTAAIRSQQWRATHSIPLRVRSFTR